MIVMLFLSSFGIIENNIIHIVRDEIIYSRYSFGYIHPNVVQMQFLMIVCMYFYLYDYKKSKFIPILFFILNYILYNYTVSRTSFIITSLIIIYICFFYNNKKLKSFINRISSYSYFLVFFISVLLAKFYSIIPLVDKLDEIFSGRIYYAAKLFNNYTIPFFGSLNYGDVMFDNSYIYLLFGCGSLFTIIYSYLFFKTLKVLKKRNMLKEIFYLVIISLYTFTENVFLSFNLNFTIYFFSLFIFETNVIEEGELNEND